MIKVVCVGKIKENIFKEAIEEYKKRLSKYTKLEIIEVQDESNGNILEKEANNILKNIKEKDYVIDLEIEGNMLSSEQLATKIDNIKLNHSNIVFIIGGSYGLSARVKERSNYHLSFSKMTFPHQLFRIILLEQIYRAFKISNNETYHK